MLLTALAAGARPAGAGNGGGLAAAVEAMAAALAAAPYAPPDEALPEALAALDYDGYRRLAFEAAPPALGGFRVMPFHRGYLFRPRVALNLVEDGAARPWAYDAAAFRHAPAAGGDLGFAGFRLLWPLNAPDRWDEVVSFLGASYFRALGQGQAYGLSARGLALGLGGHEEFPGFRAFWIAGGATRATVHALLDGPSLAGAYAITVSPGTATVMEVRAALYARVPGLDVGIAPASSMFWYGHAPPGERRPAVHDSDALLLETTAGERLLRPLDNPAAPRVTDLPAPSPRGFGLLQRRRGFAAFGDEEARYDARPSLWTEPLGDWGEGVLRLLELPARDEYHDNIALAWRPARGPRPGEAWRVGWRLRWAEDAPPVPGLARLVAARRVGEGVSLRFAGPGLAGVAAEVEGGTARGLDPDEAGATLHLAAGPAARARLARGGRPASETWVAPS
ncbi:MAG: glucan biosynthesis protein [Acetobacteraceae bacterium]|nr:glucan biosynthesis protein [Acetobacteraceae bacterium]